MTFFCRLDVRESQYCKIWGGGYFYVSWLTLSVPDSLWKGAFLEAFFEWCFYNFSGAPCMRSKTSRLHSSERKFQGLLPGVGLNARYWSWELLRAGKGRCMQKSLYFKDSFFSHHMVSTASKREDIEDTHTNVPINCPSILILRSVAQSAHQYGLWFSRHDHFVTSCPIFILGSRTCSKVDR